MELLFFEYLCQKIATQAVPALHTGLCDGGEKRDKFAFDSIEAYFNENMNDSRHSNNMDIVRYYLAFCVFIAHFSVCTGCNIPWPTPSYAAVGGFFAMSGFLIFRSYNRASSVREFLYRRVLRIVPPYVTVVLLSFAIGLVLTRLSAFQYFSSAQTWKYLASNLAFANFLEPELPGVFQNNALTCVNGSLWTMKVEWGLYLTVPVVVWLMRRVRLGRVAICLTIILLSAAYRQGFTWLYETTGREIYSILSRQFIGMMSFFYSGVLVSLLFEHFLRWRWWLATMATIVLLCGDSLPLFDTLLYPIATSVAVLLVCFVGTWGRRFATDNNFSYDIYLFHFPIIQMLVALLAGRIPLWLHFIICTAAVILVSWASWTFIGRRFVKRKKT